MDNMARLRIRADDLDRSDPSLTGGKYGDGIVDVTRMDI
jgi:hypothetical protein